MQVYASIFDLDKISNFRAIYGMDIMSPMCAHQLRTIYLPKPQSKNLIWQSKTKPNSSTRVVNLGIENQLKQRSLKLKF